MSDLQNLERKIDGLIENVASLRAEMNLLKAMQCPSPGACERLEKSMSEAFTRLRLVEFWQAGKTGQLTLIGVLSGIIGMIVGPIVVAVVKHFLKL